MKRFFIIFIINIFVFTAGNAAAAEEISVETLQKILNNNPQLILDVLRDNSEIILEIAQQGANLRRKHNMETQWREDMKKNKEVKLSGRPVLGNPEAPVKIVAFSDFSCNYCEQASKTLDAIFKEYGSNVSLVFKHLPLDEKGPGALASAWFIAIAQQNEPKAWEFYKTMYASRDKLLADGENFIKQTAQNLGIDMKQAQKEIQGKKIKEILTQDQEDGQKLGVEGTPYFLVNNLVIRGAIPLELFKSAVDMALKK